MKDDAAKERLRKRLELSIETAEANLRKAEQEEKKEEKKADAADKTKLGNLRRAIGALDNSLAAQRMKLQEATGQKPEKETPARWVSTLTLSVPV